MYTIAYIIIYKTYRGFLEPGAKTIHLDVATDIDESDDSTVKMFGCWKLHEASSQLGMSFGLKVGC